MIDFEKFKSYLDSEEGQQAMDRMSEIVKIKNYMKDVNRSKL